MTVMEKMFQKEANIKFMPKSSRVNSETETSKTGSTKRSELKVKLKLPALPNKRKSELVLDVPEGKRQKMDRNVKNHCRSILNELLSQPYAFIFSKPVDPMALGIPDYFSIISDPMDLGTIKSKLEDNLYFSAEEFAADVNLTFSNAMRYNPPHNPVHQYAEEYDHIFRSKWQHQIASCNRQIKSFGVICNGSGLNAQDTQKICSKKSLSDASSVAKRCLEAKLELRKEVMVILRGLKRTEKLQNLLQKFNLQEGELGQNIAALNVSALKELKRALKDFLDRSYTNVVPAKCAENSLDSKLRKVVFKNDVHIGGLAKSKPSVSLSSISSQCGICRGTSCVHQMSKVPASSNAYEKPLEDDSHHAANAKSQDSEIKTLLTHSSASDHDSDGLGSVDEDNTSMGCGLLAPPTTACSDKGCSPLMDDQALKKALCAAMLKSRFADTIKKASGDKADPRKMHQERERLERLQREEAAKIEAQHREEQLKLNMQLAKERQAARTALGKVERTVDLEDNMKFLRELKMLSQCSSSEFGLAFGVEIGKVARVKSPLELLGLYLKKEDYVGEEEAAILDGEREDGEII